MSSLLKIEQTSNKTKMKNLIQSNKFDKLKLRKNLKPVQKKQRKN